MTQAFHRIRIRVVNVGIAIFLCSLVTGCPHKYWYSNLEEVPPPGPFDIDSTRTDVTDGSIAHDHDWEFERKWTVISGKVLSSQKSGSGSADDPDVLVLTLERSTVDVGKKVLVEAARGHDDNPYWRILFSIPDNEDVSVFGEWSERRPNVFIAARIKHDNSDAVIYDSSLLR